MTFSELIKKLQREMNAKGENLAVDGLPGPLTRNALERFDVALSLTEGPVAPPIEAGDLSTALTMIKGFEGLRLSAYLDVVGVPTIGYGTTYYPDNSEVEIGDICSLQEATEYLLHDMQKFAQAVREMVTVQLSNNSYNALVSFCYNLGSGALQKSTLLQKLNAGSPLDEVGLEFLKYINAGGQPLKGLIRRREAERRLFVS